MTDELQTAVLSLESLRKSKAIVYSFNYRVNKGIDDSDVPIIYRCLRNLGKVDRLDLVLQTDGGSITAARRIAMLLGQYAQKFSVLVPYKARSSGTLLALSADEIVLGPLAELSPLDPYLVSGEHQGKTPPAISSEDVRCFAPMMKDWFGLSSSADYMQGFALLAQRVFPTSLTGFYRAEQYTRSVAVDLLKRQLPHLSAQEREGIVEKLLCGYWDHSHGITVADARNLGLNALETSKDEESVLWDIYSAANSQMQAQKISPVSHCNALVVSAAGFRAQHLVTWIDESTRSVDSGSWQVS